MLWYQRAIISASEKNARLRHAVLATYYVGTCVKYEVFTTNSAPQVSRSSAQ